MNYRLSSYYRRMSILWAALAFLQAFTNTVRFHFPLFSVIGWFISGAVAGGGFGAGVSQRQLRVLSRKGEIGTWSLSTILFIIGAVFIVSSGMFFLAFNAPLEVLASIIIFLSPMPSAISAVLSMMFSDWERRHKKLIFSSGWRGKVYIYPRLEQQQ